MTRSLRKTGEKGGSGVHFRASRPATWLAICIFEITVDTLELALTIRNNLALL